MKRWLTNLSKLVFIVLILLYMAYLGYILMYEGYNFPARQHIEFDALMGNLTDISVWMILLGAVLIVASIGISLGILLAIYKRILEKIMGVENKVTNS